MNCNAVRFIRIIMTAAMVVFATACSNSSNYKDAAYAHLGAASKLNNAATEIQNNFPDSPQTVQKQSLDQIMDLRKKALVEAKEIDINVFNDDEPGFGNSIRDQFVKGLDLYVNGNGTTDLLQGQMLLANFSIEKNRIIAKHKSQ